MYLYDYLNTPKTIQEITSIVHEHEGNWNESQVYLYVLLDPFIFQNDEGKWQVQQDERRQVILEAIQKAMGKRPLTKINPNVVEHIPSDYLIPLNEIREVALSSGRYDSPRDNIIRIKK